MLTALGHYRVIRRLGLGGTAEVYLADDTRLHHQVALKVPPLFVADPDRRRRFDINARFLPALTAIVHRCLAKDPEHRLRSAKDFAERAR